jgi:hypothetical protein
MIPIAANYKRPGRWISRLLASAGLALCAHLAVAQIVTRVIPDDTRRATISHLQDMYVSVDGTPALLSPGALIRDRNNLIIVPSALPREGALAEYAVDAGGQINRVWLLTSEEAARDKPRR